jgi:tRNA (cmo5U34)-methyltransferase
VRVWTESDSAHFLDVGRFYVPQRERQAAIVAALVPRLPQALEVIDLCAGEGLLAEAVLGAQPEATVFGLDGSPAMRAAAERRLLRFGARFRTAACDLHRLAIPAGAPRRAIVSSLALHHVEHAAKPALYRALHDALAPGGALVVADLVRPATPAGWELAAAGWDAAVQAADAAGAAGGAVWQRFQDERWNWFRFPDEMDRPAPIAQELDWLRAAGFTGVDVHWADCGHAIFGGRTTDVAVSLA